MVLLQIEPSAVSFAEREMILDFSINSLVIQWYHRPYFFLGSVIIQTGSDGKICYQQWYPTTVSPENFTILDKKTIEIRQIFQHSISFHRHSMIVSLRGVCVPNSTTATHRIVQNLICMSWNCAETGLSSSQGVNGTKFSSKKLGWIWEIKNHEDF